jgi:hypothetical protein
VNISSTKAAIDLGTNSGWRSKKVQVEVTRPIPQDRVVLGQIPKSENHGHGPHLKSQYVPIAERSDHGHFKMEDVVRHGYQVDANGQPKIQTTMETVKLSGPKTDVVLGTLAAAGITAAIVGGIGIVGGALMEGLSSAVGSFASLIGSSSSSFYANPAGVAKFALGAGAVVGGITAAIGAKDFMGTKQIKMKTKTDTLQELTGYRQESYKNSDGTVSTNFRPTIGTQEFSWNEPSVQMSTE